MMLTATDRSKIEKAVIKARLLLEKDFAETAAGRFGIHASGRIEEKRSLKLSAAEFAAREELVEVVEYLTAEGHKANEAVLRFLREATFTTLNRLVAIRVAEAIGLIVPSLAEGRSSRGFKELLEIFPLLGKDETGGYWRYLKLCADELARDAPILFDPRNPLLALAPSAKTLDELVGIFADPDLAKLWGQPETFGWTYQYFNMPEERREMRESPAPRNSRELAVRNQFFTPRYVVDFLVHNTLGRRLLEANPDSRLRAELNMLVGPPERRGAALDLEDALVLDPAVGSGHFLLGCYEVLERAWEERGVSAAEAAPRILPALWGIDIDPRCAQVAAASLMLRARRRRREGDLPRPNVITARPLPADPGAWQRTLANLDDGLRELVERFRTALEEAPVLGSLLKAEEALKQEIDKFAAGFPVGEGAVFGEEAARDAFSAVERRLLEAIDQVARQASSMATERLFAAETADAFHFVEAARQRYDTVLMNPPFGEPVPETKSYLKAAYPWIPWKDYNLLAAFVGRGLDLCNEHGYLGAITSRAGMFLTTFERWRKEVLLGRRFVALADFGFGVMEGALVEAAAYVVGAAPRNSDEKAVFIRLLKEIERPETLARVIAEARDGQESPLIYRVAIRELEEIPGAPLAYWVVPSIRRLFSELPPLEGSGAEVRQGLATADDFRFVRAFWEVDPGKIARTREETLQERRWVPFAKGGEYSPYYGDIHLVVDWEADGRRLREFNQAVIRNPQYYFKSGLTWPERTTSGFGPYILPRGSIFSHVGYGCFPIDSPNLVLCYLNSRLIRNMMEFLTSAGEGTSSGTAARHYLVGLVQRLPWIGARVTQETKTLIKQLTDRIILARARLDEGDETTRRFVCPDFLRHGFGNLLERVQAAWDGREGFLSTALDSVLQAETIFHSTLGLDHEAEVYLDEEYGANPGTYRSEAPKDEATFKRLYGMPIDDLIDEIVASRGGLRTITTKSYFLDRRLEILAHVFERHPEALVETRRQLSLLPPEEPLGSVEDLLSWLVGCAFGRFDVRLGSDASAAPPPPGFFDPVPLCSPGMLTGPDGLPARETPSSYPLTLPSDRILLDEEGHPLDLVTRVRKASAEVFDDPDGILEEAERVLDRDIRQYLRKQFFKDHLSRYSKSRRKAPIYWQLCVPSRGWGVWLYAPFLSREMLFAVVREARQKEGVLTESVTRLRIEQAKASGRDGVQLAKRLDADEQLVKEVEVFRKEAERVAELGWEPDLDDGIILCAAPLANLFLVWPEAAKARKELRDGKYPWATVAKWVERF